MQQSRFATTGRAHDRDKFALADLEREAAQSWHIKLADLV